MLIAINSNKLNFEFALGQPSNIIFDGLSEKFIEKYGEDVYTKASTIIIVEENFFNVIKNRYGPTQIGEHNDFLEDFINQHLAV